MKLTKKIIFITATISLIQIIITPLILESNLLESRHLFFKKIRLKTDEICNLKSFGELDQNIKKKSVYSIICELYNIKIN